MGWDTTAATNHARTNAGSASHHKCAEYTRQAIKAGGIDIGQTRDAKDYGNLLVRAGFNPLSAGEQPRKGDVVVIQPYAGGNPSGHMAIFDGTRWYSDFIQRDMWGGPGYRNTHPSFVIYRKY